MTQQETPQMIGVRHVGLSARDPAALAEFYRDVLGLQVVPVDASTLGATAFLSSRPAEVPVDLALFANPAYQHTAFEVRSLEDLRALHQRVLGRGVQVDGSDRQRRKGKDVSTEVASAEPNSASSRALAGAPR